MADDDRRFRRLDERARTTRHPLVAAPMGLLTGAVLLSALGLWEGVLLRLLGDTVSEEHWPLLGAIAAVGGALGFVAGLSGLWGPSWLLAFATCVVGLYVAAPVGLGVASGGLPAAVGVGGVVLGAAVLAHLVGRAPLPGSVRSALGAFVMLGAAGVGAAHRHLLATPSDDLALAVTALVGVLVAPVAMAWAVMGGDRRGPLVPSVGLWGLGALAHALWPSPSAPPVTTVSDRPDLVVVVVQGLRADHVGSDARRAKLTPHLHRFASNSLRYTDAQAPSSWSVPSMATLLTSLPPHAHGAGVRWEGRPTDRALRPDVLTWPQRLAHAGYATTAVVGDPGLQVYGLDAGFARWHDTPPSGPLPSMLAPAVLAGLDLGRFPLRMSARQTTDLALQALDGEPGGRALLVVYSGAGGPFDHPDGPAPSSSRPWPTDAYEEALRQLDAELGRLLDGLPPRAVVLITGDRGVRLTETRGEGHLWGQHLGPELVEVPLMVRGPSLGRRAVDDPVGLIDVGPTLVELAGAPALPKAEGQRLGRVFGAAEPERLLTSSATRYGLDAVAARKGRYRLLRRGEEERLYDLAVDPHQLEPLGQEPQLEPVRRELRAALPPDASRTAPVSLGARVGRVVVRLVGGEARPPEAAR
jgi:hypothetical protein